MDWTPFFSVWLGTVPVPVPVRTVAALPLLEPVRVPEGALDPELVGAAAANKSVEANV